MPIKPNYKTLFYISSILVVGLITYQFSGQILPFLKDFGHYIKNISEVINLLIALFIGIITVFLLKNQNVIAKIGLEQNSPVLVIDKESGGSLKINISNKSSSEAQIVSIFYKTPTSEITKLKDFTNFILNRGDNYDIEITTSKDEYHSFVILYKNQLTGKFYLIGKNIHFDEGTFPVGIKLKIHHSPISVNLFNEMSYFVMKHAYSNNLPTILEQFLGRR